MTKRPLPEDRKEEARKLKEIFNSKKRDLDLTQEKLAYLMNMNQSSVSHYLNGINPLNTTTAAVFAQLLEVQVLNPTRHFDYPEISWVQAGAASEAMDLGNISTCPTHTSDVWAGHDAFWLRVLGSSMTSPVGTSFPEGMLILVAPDMEPRSGQFVVARMADTNEATFKQLIKDAGELFLKPLNPAYPITQVTPNWVIVGT
ncbi:XRE family transcriptional regulator, partial [Pseudomonas syringae pv. actinidiae ICMP 19068]